MAEKQLPDGTWVCSAYRIWLPGIFKTRKACRLFYRLSPRDRYNLWERRVSEYGGQIPDGKAREAALSENDVTHAINGSKQGEAKE